MRIRRIDVATASFMAGYAATEWALNYRMPNNIRAALNAARGRTTVYRAVIRGGTLDISGAKGAFIADTAFFGGNGPAIKAASR